MSVHPVGRRATEPRFPLTGRTDSVTISVTDVVMKRPKQMGDMLPLTPAVFHILLALSDGERHGYALMQEVAADTGGSLQLGPGTLYGCLKRMLSARLVEESDERPDPELDDERRRYYRITTFGAGVLRAEADRLASAVSAARSKRLFSRKNLALVFARPMAAVALSRLRSDAVGVPARLSKRLPPRDAGRVPNGCARCDAA